MSAVAVLPRPALSPHLRARVEQTIEWLVGLLDATETIDEGDDLDAGELDTSDDEPSLGAPEQPMEDMICVNGRWIDIEPDQTRWNAGNADDREGDLADTADDREHDECDRGEPWLGAPETTNYGQTESQEYTWSLLGGANGTLDFEHDWAESGIGDDDGLTEQMM